MTTSVGQVSRRTAGRIPLMRPLLPTREKLAPYLDRIDDARFYTNFGPLVRLLEERLAEHLGVTPTELVLVANGTTALSAALLAAGAKPRTTCLVPSWTFVASAAAICAAGLVPRFIDVTPQTWMPDPAALEGRRDLAEVGAVMIVAPFGTPFDVARWDSFTASTGIPVIIDGAACFDTAATVPASAPASSPTMISLHATKALGAGEGGLVVSTDAGLVHRVRQVCNFGIWGSPEGQIIGYNGKLSEYHAAVGLASLDAWPQRRAALADRTERYRRELARLPGVGLLPGYGEGWASVYCTVIVPGNVHRIADHLAYLGIETRRWWQDGVHAQAAYRAFPHDELPVTAALAEHALSLPFSHDLGDDQIVRIVDALESALCAPA